MSSGNLSAIENEKAVLDTERLSAIAEALGLAPQSLFPRSPNRHFQITHQAGLDSLAPMAPNVVDRVTGKISPHHNLLRPLAGEFVGKHIAPFFIEVRPVPDDAIRFISHHHEEFFLAVRGQFECLIQTSEGVERQILVPGDCLYFRSSLPHCIRSASNEPAYALNVVHSIYGSIDVEDTELPVQSNGGAERNLTEQIADRLGAVRQSTGMSMGEFARELGISVRTLADLERGRKAASIELLLTACRRFHKPLEYFLSSHMHEQPSYFVQRASEIRALPPRVRRRLVDSTWSETQYRSLASGFGPRGMYPYYVKLRSPAPHSATLHEHHGQEFIYVLNGEVTLTTLVDGERHSEKLSAGDSCFIDSTVPHRFFGMGLSPYDESSAEIVDVYWCPLGETYLFEENRVGYVHPIAAPSPS